MNTAVETTSSGNSVTKVATMISNFLDEQAAPCTEKRIMRMVHARKQHKVAALRLLLQKGKLERSGSGKRGDPFLYSTSKDTAEFGQSSLVEEIVL